MKFSFQRFVSYLKTLIQSDMRKTLLTCLGCFVPTVLVFCAIVFALSHASTTGNVLYSILFFIVLICGVCLMGWLSIYQAGMSFESWNKRESAWLAMLLPVSQSEKYVAVYVWRGLLVPLLYMVSFGAAFGIAYLCMQVGDIHMFDTSPDVAINLRSALAGEQGSTFDGYFWTTLLIGVGVSHACLWNTCFVACSAVFKKHPILCGLGAMTAINSFLIPFVSNSIKSTGDFQSEVGDIHAVILFYLVLNIILCVVLFVLGFIGFKRRTLP